MPSDSFDSYGDTSSWHPSEQEPDGAVPVSNRPWPLSTVPPRFSATTQYQKYVSASRSVTSSVTALLPEPASISPSCSLCGCPLRSQVALPPVQTADSTQNSYVVAIPSGLICASRIAPCSLIFVADTPPIVGSPPAADACVPGSTSPPARTAHETSARRMALIGPDLPRRLVHRRYLPPTFISPAPTWSSSWRPSRTGGFSPRAGDACWRGRASLCRRPLGARRPSRACPPRARRTPWRGRASPCGQPPSCPCHPSQEPAPPARSIHDRRPPDTRHPRGLSLPTPRALIR